MEYKKNVNHSFQLKGMKSGDVFMGCPSCCFHLKPGTAGHPICPKCDTRMAIYMVKDEDLVRES